MKLHYSEREYYMFLKGDMPLVDFVGSVVECYSEYLKTINNPSSIPTWLNQSMNVKVAWMLAVKYCTDRKEYTGRELYDCYYFAVGGRALYNNQVLLSKFDEMEPLKREAWDAAAKTLNPDF